MLATLPPLRIWVPVEGAPPLLLVRLRFAAPRQLLVVAPLLVAAAASPWLKGSGSKASAPRANSFPSSSCAPAATALADGRRCLPRLETASGAPCECEWVVS